MHLILFLVGIVVAFAGAVLVLYAVPVLDVAAAALFCSGIVALVGGLILIALAAAVRNLNRIAERLEIQPLPLPPIAAVGREDPGPRPVRQAPALAAAKRPSLLASWLNRGGTPPNAAPKPKQTETEPQVDLAPLTRVPEEPRAPPAAPPASASSAPIPPPPVAPAIARTVAPPLRPPLQQTPPAAPAPNGAPDSTVYKSGVIDGMAYTLFMDGSIEADLPQGKVKFASVDELQTYLTTRS